MIVHGMWRKLREVGYDKNKSLDGDEGGWFGLFLCSRLRELGKWEGKGWGGEN